MAKTHEARLGRIVVAYEVLEEMLALPEGTTIRRVTHDSIYNRACELIVMSPEFPVLEDGAEIPVRTFTITRLERSFDPYPITAL